MNYNYDIGAATPVGVYPQGATPEGVLDLAGNVWEWCHDGYDGDYYRTCKVKGKVKNPTGPEQKARVLRGGSWFLQSGNVRCAFRGGRLPDDRNLSLGLRLVLGGVLPGAF